MNKKLKRWSLAGFFVVVLLGTLGHFLYDLTGGNSIVGKFFAVNESTWEHLKLLFFPYVLFWVVEWFCIGKNHKNFAFAGLVGVLTGLVFIVAAFYTYTGVLGKNVDFLNIAIFALGTAVAFWTEYKILTGKSNITFKIPSLIIIIVVAFLFAFFTTNTPRIGLFKDPVTGEFGVSSKELNN